MKKLIIFSTLLTLFFAEVRTANAQQPDAFFHNVTNAGREFYVTFPTCIQDANSTGSDVCRLVLFGDENQNVTVRIPGKNYEETRTLRAFVPYEWELSPALAQPFLHFGDNDLNTSALYEESAVQIVAESQIVVRVESHFGPRQANYIALPADLMIPNAPGGQYWFQQLDASRDSVGNRELPSQLYVVGLADDTQFTITSPSEYVEGSMGQDSLTWERQDVVLNRGDIYRFSPSQISPIFSGFMLLINQTYPAPAHPIAVFGSEYRANPSDSTEFDLAMFQLDPDVDRLSKLFGRALCEGNSSLSTSILVDHPLDDFSSSLSAQIGNMHEYTVEPAEISDFFESANPMHIYTYSMMFSSERDEHDYSYSLSAFPHANYPVNTSCFYVPENQGTSDNIQILAESSAGNSTVEMNLYTFDSVSNNWVLFRMLTNDIFQNTSIENFHSTTLHLPAGVYLLEGNRNSVYDIDGQALCSIEYRGGCLANEVEIYQSQVEDKVECLAYFGCNGASRVLLLDDSKNCRLNVTKHEYGSGRIEFELVLIDPNKSARANIRALSTGGFSTKKTIQWKKCSSSSKTLIDRPESDIAVTLAPFETLQRNVEFKIVNDGLASIRDIQVLESPHLSIDTVVYRSRQSKGTVTYTVHAPATVGTTTASIVGISQCNEFVTIATVSIQVDRGFLTLHQYQNVSATLGTSGESVIKIRNDGAVNTEISHVELHDEQGVFSHTELSGLTDGMLIPQDIASMLVAFTPHSVGTFYAELHVISNSHNDRFVIPIVGHAMPSSVEEQLKVIGVQAQVQPHPATENSQLHIHSSVERKIDVSFVNMRGQTVASSITKSNNEHAVDIPSSLTPGLWHAVLLIEGQQYTIPFVVE